MARQSEVTVGSKWRARVSGNHVTVEVTRIIVPDMDKPWNKGRKVRFALTNLATGRELGARTASFLRRKVS